MRLKLLFSLVALLASAVLLPATEEKLADGLYAEFTTPRGVFVAELHFREAPLTVANFVGLAEGSIAPRDGKPYYTGLKWYRVVPGFVIQSGNPRAPESGEPGYSFTDEFVPGLNHKDAGVLSMANAGPDTNGGEFFVTLGDCSRLNYLHSVFGRTVRGLEVLPLIQPDDAFSLKILRVGAAAQAFQADAASFLRELAARNKPYGGDRDPGATAHFDDPANLIPVDPPRARNFNYKLANFERATGLKIKARLFAKSPTEAEDAIPGAYMRALAAKLDVAKSGVVAAYFADENDWRVWIGDDLVATFLGRPAKPEDLGDGGALHDVKTALLEKAQAEGDAAFATQQKNAPAGRTIAPGQRIKLQTDALLDALLLRFEPTRAK